MDRVSRDAINETLIVLDELVYGLEQFESDLSGKELSVAREVAQDIRAVLKKFEPLRQIRSSDEASR